MKKNKKIIVVSLVIVFILLIIAVLIKINLFADSDNKTDDVEYVSKYFELDSYNANEDFISSQEVSNNLINEAISNKNSLEAAEVIINPYGNSPLTAVIVFTTETSESITMEMYGEEYYFEESTEHVIPIYGLISGEITVVKISSNGVSKEFTFDMTEVVFDIEIDVQTNEGTLSNGVYLFTNPMEEGAYAINELGEVVWHLEGDYTLTPIVLDNGHLLLSSSDFSSDLYSRNGIIEIDYLGKIYNYYEIEGGYHHDMELLPNGNLLVSSSNLDSESSLDYVVEIDLTTGKTVNSFDLNEIISSINEEEVSSADWLFNNGVSYHEDTNSVIFTSRLKNAVISVDYDTHELEWIFSDPTYWSSEFDDYLISYDGEYPLGMHSAEFNSNGDLIMFNNNYDKSNPQMSINYIDYNSSAVIYNLDLNDMKATLVSEFDDYESFYSYAVSTYKELENGNYIVYSGWEIDSSLFNAEENLNMFHDNTTTLYELDEENNILFKAKISIAAYAGIKTSLYSSTNSNIDISDLDYYINYDKKNYSIIDLNSIKSDLENAKDFTFSYSLTNNYFSLNAGFSDGDIVNLYFIKSDATVYKYSLKTETENLVYRVDLQDLEGQYAMFLEVNGDFYNYNVTYNFR